MSNFTNSNLGRVLQNPTVQRGFKWAFTRLGILAGSAFAIYLLPIPDEPSWLGHLSLWLKCAGLLAMPVALFIWAQRADKAMRAERERIKSERH